MTAAALDAYLEELLAPMEIAIPASMKSPAPDPQPFPMRSKQPPARELARTSDQPVNSAVHVPTSTPPARGTPDIKPGRWLRIAVDGDHYAIELLRVQEVTRVMPIMAMRGAAPAMLGVMNLRGHVVPVFDLGRWLGAGEVHADERARVVVVERNDELIGLLVSVVEDVVTLDGTGVEPPFDVGPQQRRAIDRTFLGVARPGKVPTVLLDTAALFA